MGFSERSLDFLFEICSRNDREWYHANKAEYKTILQDPMTEVAEALRDCMSAIDPLMTCRISRIYRDARTLRGRPFFRDHVWLSYDRDHDLYNGLPSFFFEVDPTGFRYGLGYYYASRQSLEAMRELILSRDETWEEAFQAYTNQKVFTLAGESYKRNHYPNEPEDVGDWLNRKNLFLIAESRDYDLLFSSRLPDELAKDFTAVKAVYWFMMKMESAWR